MGKVLKLNNKGDNKVELTLELNQNEVEVLKGNLDNMHLFSANNVQTTTKLVQRGKRDATKYFLLPKEFRSEIPTSPDVLCARLDTKTKCFIIFSVAKY